MAGGVCDIPNERCFHPITCEERGCVKQRGRKSVKKYANTTVYAQNTAERKSAP